MKEDIDYTNSYSPVGSIDSIRLLLAIAASRKLKLNVLDISNAFQTSVVFDPDDRTYITLPPFYFEWFHHHWPDYPLPSLSPKELVIQCLCIIQGCKDAGNRWYILLKTHLQDIGMQVSPLDHGVFIWKWKHYHSLSVLETDDLLMASDNDEPFLHLVTEFRKMFDLTSKQGSVLKFLNLRLIQSPHGISFDQTKHIQSQILEPYFVNTPKSSIPRHPYPFPIEASFETQLYEAPPLLVLISKLWKQNLGSSFNHLVGKLMYIRGISRPHISYACMCCSGYMACPNKPIFEALHHTLCYLYHHSHLPIMYPAKPTTPKGNALQTFWAKGHAEYLSSDCGDELATFADADHARCLRTRRSISAYFILYNGVLISWACKKQPITAIHSTASEITALHKGATKTICEVIAG